MEILNTLNFTFIFLSLIFTKLIVENYLIYRNILFIKKNINVVPKRFENIITKDEYILTNNYNISKLKFQFLSSISSLIIILLLTFGGLINFFTNLISNLTDINSLGAVLLGIIFIIISEIIEIPFSIYSTFKIEAKYGFNKTTKKTFVLDFFKSLALSIILISIIFSLIVIIVENLGSFWWLYSFISIFMFQIILFFLYPTLIAPLFNKFKPLTDEKFKKPIEKLLKKVKFEAKALMVMNASLRSTHGNAFFTGFGKNKRIVFFDTLLDTITPNEMEAILAHELGHAKLGHIKKGLAASTILSFFSFYILGLTYNSNNFFVGHGLNELTIYSKIFLFYIVSSYYIFFMRPIFSYLSRKREFEADDFSIKHTNAKYLISGLIKLAKDNSSNLTPDSLYSKYHYSHPPISERLKSLELKLNKKEI